MIAGIIGATGYAGAELVRLLAAHPRISGLALSSISFEGEQIEGVYPNFLGKVSAPLLKPDEVIARSNLVFSALPSGAGEPYANACMEKGIHFIDLSADFRFGGDESLYRAWYGKPYVYPELRKRSIYGLPELNRKKILELKSSGPVIIGNPGCYPTGASLGAFPVLAKNLAADTIIVDSASGISGGGREPQRSFHYPECADSISPYKVGSHRHSPEISRNFQAMAGLGAGNAPAVIFTPHLIPMNRGILSTIYIPLLGGIGDWGSGTGDQGLGNRDRGTGIREQGLGNRDRGSGIGDRGLGNRDRGTGIREQGSNGDGELRSPVPILPPGKEIEEKTAELRQIYADFYKDEPFVRVLPPGVCAAVNRVRLSNFCDISVHLDCSGSTLIAVSAIDNMVKGAAGQAVQNMNILMDFDETEGLGSIPALF